MSNFRDGRCNDCGGRGGLHYSDCVTEYQGDSGVSKSSSSTIKVILCLVGGFILEVLFFAMIGADASACPILSLVLLGVFSAVASAIGRAIGFF